MEISEQKFQTDLNLTPVLRSDGLAENGLRHAAGSELLCSFSRPRMGETHPASRGRGGRPCSAPPGGNSRWQIPDFKDTSALS
jgi:hypothetical protein